MEFFVCHQRLESSCHPAVSYIPVHLLDVWPHLLYFINISLNQFKMLINNLTPFS